jgi:hypothetical protein
MKRSQEGKTFLFCDEDGEKISRESRAEVTRDQALSKMRTTYETALVRVKGFIRDRSDSTVPTCFVSYAWGNTDHERWVLKLADDLRNADIDVVLDQCNNPAIGSSVTRFAHQAARRSTEPLQIFTSVDHGRHRVKKDRKLPTHPDSHSSRGSQ